MDVIDILSSDDEAKMAVDTTASDDESDDLLILPTERAPGIAAPPTTRVEQVQPIVGAPVPAEPRAEYVDDDGSEIVSVREERIAVEPATGGTETRDTRDALNEAYAVRRRAAFAARLAQLDGSLITTPTETTLVRPVEPLSEGAQTRLVDTPSGNDALLALEYVSAYVYDRGRTFVQGEDDCSDTYGFSVGREVVNPNNPDDGVPRKRVASVDADDSHPQTREAANYQHSLTFTAGRYDIALPVSALELGSQTAVASELRKINQLDNGPLELQTAETLGRIQSGVAPLFAALSTSTVRSPDEYNELRARANAAEVASNLATTLEEARAAEAPGLSIDGPVERRGAKSNDDNEVLALIEDALVERSANGSVQMVRARADSGPFTIVGAVLEYDNELPDLDDRERQGEHFDAVETPWRDAFARESRITGAMLEDDDEEVSESRKIVLDDDEEASEPRKRPRKLRRKTTIKTEAKRKLDDDDAFDRDGDVIGALDREVAEPAGENVEVDPENADELEAELKEEYTGALKSTRDTDPSQPGYLDYPWPVVAVPLGWTAEEAHRKLMTLDNRFGMAGWRLIIELAVYAKLVPRISTLPTAIRQQFVNTLALIALRVGNETTYHAESVELLKKQTEIRKLRLNREFDVLQAQLAALELDLAQDLTEDERLAALAQEPALRQRFAEVDAELRLEQSRLVSASTLPAVLVLQVTPLAYLDEMRGQMPGLLFNETQRIGLALAYATAGRRPKDARLPFETTPLDVARQDALYYPIQSYLNGLAAAAGIGELTAFATAVGELARIQADEAEITDASAGAYLAYLYATLSQSRNVNRELAVVMYPVFERRGTNDVKGVYLAPPEQTTPESTDAALDMIDYIYTDVGAFSTRALIKWHDAEVDNLAAAARAVMDERGAERLVASAAQRDVNEFFGSAYKLDDAAVVPANFDFDSGVRPVGVFTTGDEVVVERAATLKLISSDELLGGGHVVVSSVAVAPRVDEKRAEIIERIDKVRERIAGGEKLGDVLAKLEVDLAQLPKTDVVTGAAAFCYFVAPSTLATICRRANTPACQAYLAWHAGRRFDDYRDFNAFRAAAQELAAALERDSTGRVVFEFGTLDALIDEAVITITRRQLLVLREETTRPDAVATQPFSCLAALARATKSARVTMRDVLYDIWYDVAAQRQWRRLGYMQMLFNSSHAIELPPVVNDYQMLHLGLRQAARQLRRLPHNDDKDEGDSDNEDAEIDDDRERALLQVKTLLIALELEVSRTHAAHTLWFDLFVIGRAPAAFAAKVRSALLALYTALASGRDVVGLSVLASRTQTSQKPLSIDPRAQPLVDTYWEDFGVATVEYNRYQQMARTMVEAANDASYESTVEKAYYDTVATSGPAPKPAASRAAAKSAFTERVAAAIAAAPAERQYNQTHPVSQKIEELVVQLAVADKDEAKVYERIAALTDQENERYDPAQVPAAERERQIKVREIERLERRIRAAYASNDARLARVRELIEANIKLQRDVRVASVERTALGSQERLKMATIELRAALYADERQAYARELQGRLDKIRAQLAALPLERARPVVLDEITRAAAAEREALKARVSSRTVEPTAEEEAEDLRLATALIRSERIVKAFRTRVDEPDLVADLDALRQRATSLVRPPTSTQKAEERELKLTNNDINKVRVAIYPPIDVRERAQANALSKEEADEAESRIEAKRTEAMRAKDAVDAKMLELMSGKLATTDRRSDTPATRETIGSENDFDGYYDAPLANLKPLTIEGVKLARTLMRDAQPPAAIINELTLLLPAARHDAYVTVALELIGRAFDDDDDETPGRLRMRPTEEDEFRTVLLAHVELVVNEAISSNIRLRFKAASLVGSVSLEENDVVRDAQKAARAVFDKVVSDTKLGRKLSKIETAALQILREKYETYERSRHARAILALGTVDIVRDATNEFDVPEQVPRVVATLLMPAAIERAKLDSQANEPVLDQPWAVAHRQDAPQAWRIAEIVDRFVLTGRVPLPPATSVAATSPFAQYVEIRSLNAKIEKWQDEKRALLRQRRKASEESLADINAKLERVQALLDAPYEGASPTPAATGRLRYFPDRVEAMRGFGTSLQRVSVGNGLHVGQPSGVDLAAAAACAQLMTIYASVQRAYGGPLNALGDVLANQDVTLTRRVAQLPARDRLWCHLAMFYGQLGAPTELPVGTVKLAPPSWHDMRAVDIRLLALVILGYDWSPQETADAYTRGHTAKFMLAAAYYDDYVESRFTPQPDARELGGVPPEQTEVLFAVAQRAGLEGLRFFIRRGGQRRTTTSAGAPVVAQYNEAELRSVVEQRIFSLWTAAEGSTVNMTSLATPDVGGRIRALASGAGREVVKNALIDAAAGAPVNDHAWLLIPRCVILGALVQIALTAKLPTIFRGRLDARTSLKQRVLATLERILLVVDASGHLLRDEAAPVGRPLLELDAKPLAPQTVVIDDDEPTPAPVVRVPVLDARGWRVRVQGGIKTLLGAEGTLVGTTRQAPFGPDEWPFGPVPTSTPLLSYTQQILYVDDAALELWQRIRPAIVSVSAFYGAMSDVLERTEANVDVVYRRMSATLSDEQRALGSLLVRAEFRRRQHWQPANTSTKSMVVAGGAYRDWHNLLLEALAEDATPLAALRAYAEKNPSAEATRLLSAEKPRVTAVQIEQIVPVYDTLLYYFDTTTKGRNPTQTLYKTTQRYPLWALLAAPLKGVALVAVETTEQRDKNTGSVSCAVALQAYVPVRAFTADEARAEAQTIPLSDTARVVVVHQHVFAKLDDEPPSKTSGVYGSTKLTTLARYVVVPGAYTVDDAIQAAAARATPARLLGVGIPTSIQ